MKYLKTAIIVIATILLLAIVIIPLLIGFVAAGIVTALLSGWYWFRDCFDWIDEFWSEFLGEDH